MNRLRDLMLLCKRRRIRSVWSIWLNNRDNPAFRVDPAGYLW